LSTGRRGELKTGILNILCREERKNGSALITVLWILIFLSVLAFSFAFNARIELRLASYHRKKVKAESLANSGMEVARMLMMKSEDLKKIKDPESDEAQEAMEQWWYQAAKRLSDGLTVNGLRHSLGDGEIVMDIVPEPARRNINVLDMDDWARVLQVGGVPEEMWPGLVDSIMDWTDRDSVTRLDGAETEDYYALLSPPRRAGNGPFNTVDELLLVKDFNEAILYGGVLNTEFGDEESAIEVSGIADMLTVYSERVRRGRGRRDTVNINAVSERVLLTLPGIDENIAAIIVEEREGWEDENGVVQDSSFRSVEDFLARVPEVDASIGRYISTTSSIYGINLVGTVGGVERKVKCVASFSGRELHVLEWTEE